MLCLIGSALALGLAPLMMLPDYSWVAHTTSEAAAQGISGAWLARLGFLSFGLAVLWLASIVGDRWGNWGRLLHRSFGVLLLATAAFSHRPLDPTLEFDQTEDLLHSVAATAMGFAFALGVVAVALQRRIPFRSRRVLDAVAVVASIVIPLGMMTWSGYAGLLQRAMFMIAYFWYAMEALPGSRRHSTNGGD